MILLYFFKERKPKTLDELAQLAEQYWEAHLIKSVAKDGESSYTADKQQSSTQQFLRQNQQSPIRRCYNCNKVVMNMLEDEM